MSSVPEAMVVMSEGGGSDHVTGNFTLHDPVVACELADIEVASVLARARREGRIDDAGLVDRLKAYEDHTADDGPIGVVALTRDTIVLAHQSVLDATVRTLDALHLTAARLLAEASEDDVAF